MKHFIKSIGKNSELKKEDKHQLYLIQSITLKNIENIQKENLERTSDLTSIRSEIERLRAEKQAMEESMYEDTRSYGRGA